MISRNLLVGFVSVTALTLSGVGAAAAASTHASAHGANSGAATSVRPALDESQGCWYRVDQDNIALYPTDTGGNPIAYTNFDDLMVSAPLDETGSGTTGWEYVMDPGNWKSGVLHTGTLISGWIQKQYMVFLGCSGPKYVN